MAKLIQFTVSNRIDCNDPLLVVLLFSHMSKRGQLDKSHIYGSLCRTETQLSFTKSKVHQVMRLQSVKRYWLKGGFSLALGPHVPARFRSELETRIEF